jgi:starch-binding outer membrane protein, SusD/RagB family
MKITTTHGRRMRGRTFLRGVLAAGVFVLGACDFDSILEIEDIDVTRSEDLFDPGNLPALRASALGDFAAAFSGTSSTGVPGLVHASGLLADEFWHSGTFGQNREIDRRQVAETNGFVQSMALNMYRARRIATLGFESYARNQPDIPAHAEMASLQGYIYVFFAENFCNGVPFSDVMADGRFEYSAALSTAQMLGRARDQFTQARTIATAAHAAAGTAGARAAAEAQIHLAALGLARVELGLGNRAQAAALVSGVPTSWVYNVEHSNNTGRQNNGVWGNNHGRLEIALSNNEGGTGVNFRRGNGPALTVINADPRLPWSWRNGATDSRSIHYFQRKYAAQGDPVALASGIQARLIEAEAALDAGQSAAYLTTLNTLRAAVNLPPLSDPGTAAARIDQFFSERAMWLFGTANRLGDLRRLVRHYNRPVASVFPSGTYFREGLDGPRVDGTYGTTVNFPITIDEQNNPQFQQCIDRNP